MKGLMFNKRKVLFTFIPASLIVAVAAIAVFSRSTLINLNKGQIQGIYQHNRLQSHAFESNEQKTNPNLRLYENEIYGYRVGYPDGWMANEKNNEYITVGFTPASFNESSAQNGEYYPIFISFYNNKGYKTIEDYYYHSCDNEKGCAASSNLYLASTKTVPITVGGTEAIQFFNVERGPVLSTITSFIHDQYIIEIIKHDIAQKSINSEVEEVYKQVLGSFDFF
jgi:hypothetical protein